MVRLRYANSKMMKPIEIAIVVVVIVVMARPQ